LHAANSRFFVSHYRAAGLPLEPITFGERKSNALTYRHFSSSCLYNADANA
jgi:hypothetical protein